MSVFQKPFVNSAISWFFLGYFLILFAERTESLGRIGRNSFGELYKSGFDGYVDTISRVVRRKGADGSVEYFSTIAEFGAHVTAKAGKSASIELRAQQVRAGGNLPLFAKALCALGVEVTAVGAMGWPQLHPAFEELAAHPLQLLRRQVGQTVAKPVLKQIFVHVCHLV